LKKGFGLISALMILILVATLIGMVAKISFISARHVGDSYKIQRAELFMQSAIENAILAIEGYKRDSSCLKNIHFLSDDKKFEANITVMRYYCYDLSDCPCAEAVKVDNSDSHGWVVLKVIVSSLDKKIRLEKVTLQRP
jgi:hypothetical protein